jgi:hypothetical protein
MTAIAGAGIHDEVRWEIHRKRIEVDRSTRAGHWDKPR